MALLSRMWGRNPASSLVFIKLILIELRTVNWFWHSGQPRYYNFWLVRQAQKHLSTHFRFCLYMVFLSREPLCCGMCVVKGPGKFTGKQVNSSLCSSGGAAEGFCCLSPEVGLSLPRLNFCRRLEQFQKEKLQPASPQAKQTVHSKQTCLEQALQ